MNTKQVIVMRTDLGMRKGKMIAQGSHASMAFLTKDADIDRAMDPPFITSKITRTQVEWLDSSFIKICVRVDSEQELLDIHQAAEAAGIVSHLITDNGLTEFGGVPTKTCCAIGPDVAEEIDKVTGHLTLL